MIASSDKTRAWALFALLFASFAYFYQGVGPNQNSRFDLVRAIVDRHTFTIDAYEKNTIDKAEANGHVYSDKAPGVAFASVPVYFVVRVFQGFATPTRNSARAALYVITAVVIGAVSAAAAARAYLFLRRLDVGAVAALGAVLAWSLGSNQFAYATLYVSHAFAAALLLLMFDLLHAGGSSRRFAIAGLLGGWAAITEYPAAALLVMAAAYVLKRHDRRALVPFFAAAAVPLLLLALYNTACFGSPFTLGYDRLSNATYRAAMSRGVYGVALPSPTNFVRLLFGEFRGLVPLAPWALAAITGFTVLLRKDSTRRFEGAFLTAAALVPFLVAASYSVWDGGAAMGPRHGVIGLPFIMIGAALGFDLVKRVRAPLRAAVTAVATASVVYAIAICTACVAVMPEFPDAPIPIRVEDMATPDPERPLTTLVLPLIARGYVSIKGTNAAGQLGFAIGIEGHDDDSINLGERLGLSGRTSLAPLLLLWLAFGAFFARTLFMRPKTAAPPLVSDDGAC